MTKAEYTLSTFSVMQLSFFLLTWWRLTATPVHSGAVAALMIFLGASYALAFFDRRIPRRIIRLTVLPIAAVAIGADSGTVYGIAVAAISIGFFAYAHVKVLKHLGPTSTGALHETT